VSCRLSCGVSIFKNVVVAWRSLVEAVVGNASIVEVVADVVDVTV
jgi:hypothetical protein